MSGNSVGEGALRHAAYADCQEGRSGVADPRYNRGRTHEAASRLRREDHLIYARDVSTRAPA